VWSLAQGIRWDPGPVARMFPLDELIGSASVRSGDRPRQDEGSSAEYRIGEGPPRRRLRRGTRAGIVALSDLERRGPQVFRSGTTTDPNRANTIHLSRTGRPFTAWCDSQPEDRQQRDEAAPQCNSAAEGMRLRPGRTCT
jgi:hypothetical protein